LKEADGSAKIVDVTNGSKDKRIQKVIDYIKKVLQDKIGKDKLGKKIYAYLKNASGNCLLYVFAGVKQDKLDESVLNEADDVKSHLIDILAHAGEKGYGTATEMANMGITKKFIEDFDLSDKHIQNILTKIIDTARTGNFNSTSDIINASGKDAFIFN